MLANQDLDIEDFLNAIGFIPPEGFTLDLTSVEPVIDDQVSPGNEVPQGIAGDVKAFTHFDGKNKLESNEQDPSFFREPGPTPEPVRHQWYTPIETNPEMKGCPLTQIRDWDDMKTYEVNEGHLKGTRFSLLRG